MGAQRRLEPSGPRNRPGRSSPGRWTRRAGTRPFSRSPSRSPSRCSSSPTLPFAPTAPPSPLSLEESAETRLQCRPLPRRATDPVCEAPAADSSPISGSIRDAHESPGVVYIAGSPCHSADAVARSPLMQANSNPVPGQPTFGSVWWVENRFLWKDDFNPEPDDGKHPVAVAIEGKPKGLRLRPTLEAVPRTSSYKPELADDFETPKGDPPRATAPGTFMCRYRVPVRVDAFRGFDDELFLGELCEASKATLRDLLKLSRTLRP